MVLFSFSYFAYRNCCRFRIVADVTRLLIDILFDEEIIGEDVSMRESSAEPKGSDASLKSVGAFFTQLHEGKISGAD